MLILVYLDFHHFIRSQKKSTIYVWPDPVADFDLDSIVCLGDSSIFESTSYVPIIPDVPQDYPDPSKFIWSIDNIIVQEGGITFDTILNNEGCYDIKLHVTSITGGCTDSIVKSVCVYRGPTANFAVDSIVCLDAGTATIFDGNLSTPGSTNITNYYWDFEYNPFPGNEVFSSNVSGFASHQYTGIFTYTALLTVTDEKGCQDSQTKNSCDTRS